MKKWTFASLKNPFGETQQHVTSLDHEETSFAIPDLERLAPLERRTASVKGEKTDLNPQNFDPASRNLMQVIGFSISTNVTPVMDMGCPDFRPC